MPGQIEGDEPERMIAGNLTPSLIPVVSESKRAPAALLV